MKAKARQIIQITLMVFTIAIFAPLEIYLTNIDEFWFKFADIFKMTLLCFVILEAFGIIFLFVLDRINHRLSMNICFIVFAVGMLIYIQGNYVANTAGLLDGHKVQWNTINIDRIESILLWIIGIAIIVTILIKVQDREKITRISAIIAVCVILVEIVTLGSVALINSDQFSRKTMYYPTSDDEMLLSDEENVIIFVLDSFDSRLMAQIVEEDKDGTYSSMLDGFTYYPDTMGCFNLTDLALPEILTGQPYHNEQAYDDYVVEGYNSCPLYTEMLEDDWSMGIYSMNELTPCDFVKNLCNTEAVDKFSISSHRRFLEYIYKLVAYKYAPYELKRFCWFNPADYDNLRDYDDERTILFDWANETFLNNIDDMSLQSEDKVFRLYHLLGTHLPYKTNEYGQDVDYEVEPIENAKGNLYMLSQYIDKLKEYGIYDKTAIIVMADHGLPLDGDEVPYRQNPLLMIKGTAESHDLIVSDKPLSYTNLNTIYTNFMENKEGEDIVAGIDNGDRYGGYYRGDVTIVDTHTAPINELMIEEGKTADSYDNVIMTGKVYQWEEE